MLELVNVTEQHSVFYSNSKTETKMKKQDAVLEVCNMAKKETLPQLERKSHHKDRTERLVTNYKRCA